MIDFLAMDLDGTLVPSTLKLSEKNRQAVAAAKEKGVLVTIATGRMTPSAQPFVKQLGIDIPFITYNGAKITEPKSGKVWNEFPVDRKLTKSLLELCREKGWYIQAYQDDKLLVHEINEKSKLYSYISGVEAIAIGNELWKIDSATKLLAIASNREEQTEIGQAFRNYFSGQGNIAESLGNYVEITAPEAEKGKAVEFLCDYFNIPLHRAMAIGDGGNDVGMIQKVGFGIAMGGARKELKDIAKGVTGLSEDDGVAEAIGKYILKM